MVAKRHGRAWLGMLIIVAALCAGCTTVSVGQTTPTPLPSATASVGAGGTGTAAPAQPGEYGPADLRAAYRVAGLIAQGFTGKGQTIIDMVCYGSPTVQADLDVYSKRYGLPSVKVQTLNPLTTPLPTTSNSFISSWGTETEIDVELYHALAPDAGIIVLASPVCAPEGITGLPEQRQQLQYVVDHHLGTIIAVSGGTSELTLTDPAARAELTKWDALLKTATTQAGYTFFVSSGDNGATDYKEDGTVATVPTTSFPTDSPWVTSVGGTSLLPAGSGFHETAWGKSGGGFSSFFAEPDYQKALPQAAQKLLNGRRGVPDVAAVADGTTGVQVYVQGGWSTFGGTSISAPIWAGIMAIANQKAGKALGFINPALYQIGLSGKAASDFNDVTVGNNTQLVSGTTVPGYPAVVGWDPVTGFGSPRADTLIPDLIAALTGK